MLEADKKAEESLAPAVNWLDGLIGPGGLLLGTHPSGLPFCAVPI
jgi:hypothetical protein